MAAEAQPIPPRPSASWRTALVGLAAGLVIGSATYVYLLSSRRASEPVRALEAPRALEPILVTPVEADTVAIAVVSSAAEAKMTLRGEAFDLPVALEIDRGVHPELVEVSAQGFEARRYWVRLDKPRRLLAKLSRGQGSRDATREETQIALGEIDDPHPSAEPIAEPMARRVLRSHRGARAGADPRVPVTVPPPKASSVSPAAAPAPSAAAAPAPSASAPSAATPTPSPAPGPRPSMAVAGPGLGPHATAAPRSQGALAKPTVVAAAKIEPTRLAGQRQIGLPEDAVRAMLLQNLHTTEALVKVCLSAAGAPTLVEVVKSTGFPIADAQLRSEIGRWRYRPYLVDGQAAPICTAVAFRYKLR